MAIPLSYLAQVLPGVLSAGANQNTLFALMLTKNAAFPTGTVQQVTSAASVASLVGSDQLEATLATTYFTGFTNSPRKPSILYVARFVDAATPASLIGGKVSLTLAQIKALTGSFSISIDGAVKVVTPALSAVKSMSDVATAIQTAIGVNGVTVAYSSGSAGFTITSGTKTATSSVGYATGDLSASFSLTSATGAVQSSVVVDAGVMAQLNALKNANGMWSHFFCAFDPKNYRDDMVTWTSAQNDWYGAILHDTSVTSAEMTAGTSWAQTITANGAEGICPVYQDPNLCALIASVPGCVNWTAVNGRYNVAFRRSSVMTPTVTDEDTATALEAAGYNFYGQFAGTGTTRNGIYPGSVTGQYLWMDSFFNQIWMRRNFQLNLIDLLFNKGQIPYNTDGSGLVESSVKPTIDTCLNFGSIRTGISLSESQIQEITQIFGNNAAQTIETSGYYLYVDMSSVTASDRQKRATPTFAFYYTDGQSVQRITMNSVEVA